MHGKNDEVIPIEHGKRLYNICNNNIWNHSICHKYYHSIANHQSLLTFNQTRNKLIEFFKN